MTSVDWRWRMELMLRSSKSAERGPFVLFCFLQYLANKTYESSRIHDLGTIYFVLSYIDFVVGQWRPISFAVLGTIYMQYGSRIHSQNLRTSKLSSELQSRTTPSVCGGSPSVLATHTFYTSPSLPKCESFQPYDVCTVYFKPYISWSVSSTK